MIKVIIFKQNNCSPCSYLTNSIDLHEGDELNDIELVYANMSDPTDEVIELAAKYNVRAAPTTVILKDGEVHYIGIMVKNVDDLLGKVK